MTRPIPALACLALLGACAEPRIEFRGYSDLSSCNEIIDAELANGAGFEGVFASEDLEDAGFVTELSGEIFGERVQIEVFCDARGFPGSVHYLSGRSDPRETGEVFHHFTEELEALFGEPTFIVTDDGRSLRFLCHSPSPVILDEWRLPEALDVDETEQPAADVSAVDEEPPHEVYLAIVPSAAECLDAER